MTDYEFFVLKYEYRDDGLLYSKASKQIVGTHNNEGYIRIRGSNGKEYRAHRIIWSLFNGEIPEGMLIDHIDGNRSNNRIENLRLATRIQNNANKMHTYEHGLPKGVTKVGSKFRARLYHKGKNYSLGCFNTVEEAEEAYNKKAIEIHGEFAYIKK